MEKAKVLVTGGMGYIGSHTVVKLLEQGFDVVIADNLYNSKVQTLDKIEKICGKRPSFVQLDLMDSQKLEEVFEQHNFEGVIHFAGLKAVAESHENPLWYYRTNLITSLNLLESMKRHSVKKLIFSSSATVYKPADGIALKEDFPIGASNPYGSTKQMIEQIVIDFQRANPEFACSLLRYFNPIGAHESGLIGEDPNGIPNNLLPIVARVAFGKMEKLSVFGSDYNTVDGTCVRDFIHVQDLAEAHICALRNLEKGGLQTFNIGTGNGQSVLQVVHAFEKATGMKVPYVFAPARAGDLESVFSDSSKAQKELGWTAKKTLGQMCFDAMNYQKKTYENEKAKN